MRNETSCSIIRDLLPNYAEGLTSPETSEVVKAHLEKIGRASCRERV